MWRACVLLLERRDYSKQPPLELRFSFVFRRRPWHDPLVHHPPIHAEHSGAQIASSWKVIRRWPYTAQASDSSTTEHPVAKSYASSILADDTYATFGSAASALGALLRSCRPCSSANRSSIQKANNDWNSYDSVDAGIEPTRVFLLRDIYLYY